MSFDKKVFHIFHISTRENASKIYSSALKASVKHFTVQIVTIAFLVTFVTVERTEQHTKN